MCHFDECYLPYRVHIVACTCNWSAHNVRLKVHAPVKGQIKSNHLKSFLVNKCVSMVSKIYIPSDPPWFFKLEPPLEVHATIWAPIWYVWKIALLKRLPHTNHWVVGKSGSKLGTLALCIEACILWLYLLWVFFLVFFHVLVYTISTQKVDLIYF